MAKFWGGEIRLTNIYTWDYSCQYMDNTIESANPKSSANVLIIVFAVIVVAAAVLFLFNRNKGSADMQQSAQTPTTAVVVATDTPTTGDTESPSSTAAGALSISIKGFKFTPDTITINKGDTVTWTNEDSATHTIAAADKSFDSGNLPNGKTFSHTFDKVGTVDYICGLHPSMKGKVVVK